MKLLNIPLIVLFLATSVFSCHRSEQSSMTLPPVQVTVVKIARHEIPANFEYVGVAQSSHLVEIRARVEGYLEQIAFQEGTFVQKDQLLFQIDSKPFQAELDNAKGELARQEARLWEAQRSVDRLNPLYEKNAASRRDLDNALATQMSASADVESAKAKVTQAELNLGYTTIRSPIGGLTSQSNFREGSLVTPGMNGLLTTVSKVDPIWVNFSVSQSDILKTRIELEKKRIQLPKDLDFDVILTLSDGSTFPFKGKVNFSDPSLTLNTGTMTVRAIFANPEGIIMPGQFVRAKIEGAVRPHAIVIPQKAVMQGQKGLYVFVVNSQSQAEIRYIDAGNWFGDDWIIQGGLEEGDQVIVDGINKIQPGSVVAVQSILNQTSSPTTSPLQEQKPSQKPSQKEPPQ